MRTYLSVTPACKYSPVAPRTCSGVGRRRPLSRKSSTKQGFVRNDDLHAGRLRQKTSTVAVALPTNDQSNPDLDDVVLDEDYYKEMGMEPWEIEADNENTASDLDPEGRDFKLDDLYEPMDEEAQHLMDELYDDEMYGDPAVVLAGFQAEELAMVRAILDSAGGHDIKVIPCVEAMLHEPVGEVLQTPEIDWAEPRPADFTRGGAWGSNRVILFAGMKLVAQAALVELLECAGLPPVCVALALEEEADELLGAVLTRAVREQRGRKNPKEEVWEGSRHSAEEAPSLEAEPEELELEDGETFEDFVQRQAARSIEEFQRKVASGDWQDVVAKRTADGKEETLGDIAAGFDRISVTVDPGDVPDEPSSAQDIAARFDRNSVTVDPEDVPDEPASAGPLSPKPQPTSPPSDEGLRPSPYAASTSPEPWVAPSGLQPLTEDRNDGPALADSAETGPGGPVNAASGVWEGTGSEGPVNATSGVREGSSPGRVADPLDQPAAQELSTEVGQSSGAGTGRPGAGVAGARPPSEGFPKNDLQGEGVPENDVQGKGRAALSQAMPHPENPNLIETQRLQSGAAAAPEGTHGTETGEAEGTEGEETGEAGPGPRDQGFGAPSRPLARDPRTSEDEEFVGYGSGAKELVFEGGQFRVRTSAELEMTARPLRPGPVPDTSSPEGQPLSATEAALGDVNVAARGVSLGAPRFVGADNVGRGVGAGAEQSVDAGNVGREEIRDGARGAPDTLKAGDRGEAPSVVGGGEVAGGRGEFSGLSGAGAGSAGVEPLYSGRVADDSKNGAFGQQTGWKGIQNPPSNKQGVQSPPEAEDDEEEEEHAPALPKEVMERVKQESLAFMTQIGNNAARIPITADPQYSGSDFDEVSAQGADLIDAIAEGREADDVHDYERAGAPWSRVEGSGVPTVGPALQGLGKQMSQARVLEQDSNPEDAVVETLKKSIADMPAEEKARLGKDLKTLEAEKPEVEAVLKDLDAAFGSMKGKFKEELQAKLREEAQEPTREAIQAALACGLSADELIRMVNEASGRCTVAVAPITDDEAATAQEIMRKRNTTNATSSASPTTCPALGDARPADDTGAKAQSPASNAVSAAFTAHPDASTPSGSMSNGSGGDSSRRGGEPAGTDTAASTAVDSLPASRQEAESPPVSGGDCEGTSFAGPVTTVDSLPMVGRELGGEIEGTSAAGSVMSGRSGEGGEWDTSAKAPDRPAGGMRGVNAARASRAGQGGARTLTPEELRDLAERRGLSIEQLLADANARGISLGG